MMVIMYFGTDDRNGLDYVAKWAGLVTMGYATDDKSCFDFQQRQEIFFFT